MKMKEKKSLKHKQLPYKVKKAAFVTLGFTATPQQCAAVAFMIPALICNRCDKQRDTDSPHRDVARLPLLIVEL